MRWLPASLAALGCLWPIPCHRLPPPPRGRPAPDLYPDLQPCAFRDSPIAHTHSANSLTIVLTPTHAPPTPAFSFERARIFCARHAARGMHYLNLPVSCKHAHVVCPADHPPPANDDEQTQPVDAIVGGDEQQRARSGRATASRAAQREALAVALALSTTNRPRRTPQPPPAVPPRQW